MICVVLRICWRGTSTTQNSTSNRRRHFSRLTRNCMDEAGGLRSGFGGLGAAGRNSHRIYNFVVFDPARCYIRGIMSHPSPRSRGNPAASGVLSYIRTKCPTKSCRLPATRRPQEPAPYHPCRQPPATSEHRERTLFNVFGI